MEMSAEFQTSLNQAATNKKPIEGEKKAAEGEPEPKRIKTEMDMSAEQLQPTLTLKKEPSE